MIDPYGLFDVYLKVEVSSRQELDAGRRITDASERVRMLEQRLKTAVICPWCSERLVRESAFEAT